MTEDQKIIADLRNHIEEIKMLCTSVKTTREKYCDVFDFLRGCGTYKEISSRKRLGGETIDSKDPVNQKILNNSQSALIDELRDELDTAKMLLRLSKALNNEFLDGCLLKYKPASLKLYGNQIAAMENIIEGMLFVNSKECPFGPGHQQALSVARDIFFMMMQFNEKTQQKDGENEC